MKTRPAIDPVPENTPDVPANDNAATPPKTQRKRRRAKKRPAKKRLCSIPACGRPHNAKGLCSAHYQRLKHGWSLRHPLKARLVGSVADRLKAYTEIDPLTGCHVWTGRREMHGYGRMGVKGRNYMVHRLAWELSNGPIPEGKIVMHTCDNRACCNPEHLKLGTHRDNLIDRLAKKRGKGCWEEDLQRHPQWGEGRPQPRACPHDPPPSGEAPLDGRALGSPS